MTATIENEQPSLALTEAICLQGIFPGDLSSNTDFVGSLHMFAFNFTSPTLFVPNGQTLSISSNTAAFSLLQNTYGGNGTTTFALPDLRHRLTIGDGTNPTANPYAADHPLGQMLGQERVALSTADLPAYYGGGTSSLGSSDPYWTLNDAPSLAIHNLIAIYGPYAGMAGDVPAIGTIVQYVGNYIPGGMMECDGQLLNIADNDVLFSILGTTYGGDGITTFALPDLRGRTIVGASDSLPLGTSFGSDTINIGDGNMPAGMGGANAALDNYQPSLALNYIICLVGPFPSPDGINLSNGPVLGEIMVYAGTVPPTGWAFCSGQTLSINQNQALFSLLQNTFGGNGTTTFALPDLRGTAVIGADGDFGQHYGSAGITLGMDDIPGVIVHDSDLGSFIHGAGQADSLYGNGGNDTIYGHGGRDLLDGGAGADTMRGGAGNDTYIVDDIGDRAIENLASGGIDLVKSSLSFVLGNNLENLTLTGTDAINGTGNALANTIVGNSADNILDGRAGADHMNGGLGNDTYIIDNAGDLATEATSAGGVDLVKSSISFTLGAYIENLTLTGTAAIDGTGNGLANTIIGNSGNNVLDGGAGADKMNGGLGDDTYIVGNIGDQVIEGPAAGGIDLVKSSVSFTLGENIENLTLTSSSAINGTGNNLANVIVGNDGSNILTGNGGGDSLSGGPGADILHGGSGNDMLTGGGGADLFCFDTVLNAANNVDQITDFTVVDDAVQLAHGIFGAAGPLGTLSADAFFAGTAAHDADDRIIYDSATGNLYYDADGNGAGAQVLFAHLSTGLALTNADFSIVG